MYIHCMHLLEWRNGNYFFIVKSWSFLWWLQSQFYEEAEQALEHLLLSKPDLLSHLAGNMGGWESVLPENVLRQMPYTLIK